MKALLILVTAMAISMVLLPLMVRCSPYMGMIDLPDPRKVHTKPIARVGGIGIVIGALVPMVVWLPMDDLIRAYILGSLVLFGFGLADDRKDLGHYPKFIGQFIAVGLVVFWGDLSISRIPLMGLETLPSYLSIPFTIFAMVGVINAINHSDGLDGLAGGESLLSLLGIAFLAYQSSDGAVQSVLIACAVMGGVIGFLRFNTHPAGVFMGDSGSQFLGFTLGFLVIFLTQRVNTALSPAIPALLLGLPVIDILAVLFLRIKERRNWFQATRNHIHHRLLDRGFSHQTTVVLIYSTQALFVVSALLLKYESDWVILSLYVAFCFFLFAFLTVSERRNWTAKSGVSAPSDSGRERFVRVGSALFLLVRIVIPAGMIYLALVIPTVPKDIAAVSAVLALTMLVTLSWGRGGRSVIPQGIVFIGAMFIVFLCCRYYSPALGEFKMLETGFYGALAVAIGMTLKFAKALEFKTSASDYLALFLVLLLSFFQNTYFLGVNVAEIVVKSVIVLYGCEMISFRDNARWSALNLASMGSLGILAFRGLT